MKSSLHSVQILVIVALMAMTTWAFRDKTKFLFPQPKEAIITDTLIDISLIVPEINGGPILAYKMWERYYKLIFYKKFPELKSGKPIVMVATIKNNSDLLSMETNVSYKLDLKEDKILIETETVFGFLYALETLSQVIDYEEGRSTYSGFVCSISDSARYEWRGIMVDSARHFEPIGALKRQIDALSYTKMNTMHWHIVDGQSFPLISETFPELNKASYGDHHYTHAEVRELVQYGLERGVRLVPEVDLPGHSGFWGIPEITRGSHSDGATTLATREKTYDVLKGYMGELVSLFPDEYFHLGGDEVNYGAWSSDQEFDAFLTTHDLDNVNQLANYFWNKVLESISPKIPVFWDEVLDAKDRWNLTVPPGTIFDSWRGTGAMTTAISKGYRSILSAYYYLDRHHPGGSHYLWGDTWYDFYRAIPEGSNDNAGVMGGQACMWGEQVDETDIDTRIWPRAAAVGERTWTGSQVKDGDKRIDAHRCRLARRGIQATPLKSGPPCQYP